MDSTPLIDKPSPCDIQKKEQLICINKYMLMICHIFNVLNTFKFKKVIRNIENENPFHCVETVCKYDNMKSWY